jgi:hypothetical protein
MVAALAAGLVAALAAGDTEAARTANAAIGALLGASSGLFDKSFNIVPARCYASQMRRRPPHAIDLSAADAGFLKELLRDGHTEQRIARRARILLAMGDPATVVQDLADRLDVERTTIWHLCRRYEEAGVQVVGDAPREGRPRTFSPSPTRGHRAARVL